MGGRDGETVGMEFAGLAQRRSFPAALRFSVPSVLLHLSILHDFGHKFAFFAVGPHYLTFHFCCFCTFPDTPTVAEAARACHRNPFSTGSQSPGSS